MFRWINLLSKNSKNYCSDKSMMYLKYCKVSEIIHKKDRNKLIQNLRKSIAFFYISYQ